MSKEITNKITLAEILEIKGAKEILAKHKVPCLTCPMAQYEMKELTAGTICQMYGLDENKLLADLNKSSMTRKSK